MPQRYRSKVDFVDALLLDKGNLNDAAIWCGGEIVDDYAGYVFQFPTLNGVGTADIGEYLIRGKDGRFTTMTKVAFEEKYEIGSRIRGDEMNPPTGVVQTNVMFDQNAADVVGRAMTNLTTLQGPRKLTR